MDFKLAFEYTKNLTVLYVEDDEAIRASTTKVFEHFFRHVDTAADGLDAMNKIELYRDEYGITYDLIITDINMPILNGIDMAKKILKHAPEQSIIFVTAHSESAYMIEAIRMGASSFMIKPLQIDELAVVLYKVCQAICDRQIAQRHFVELEEYSLQLKTQNEELEKRNEALEKSLRILDTVIYKQQYKPSEKKEEFTKACVVENAEDRVLEQIGFLVREDLPELRELRFEIDACLIKIINAQAHEEVLTTYLPQISTSFLRYASILQLYSFYFELGKALSDFACLIQTEKLPNEHDARMNIFLIFESFMHVLGRWQDELVMQDPDRLNYLDASMMSDISMITNMWKQVVIPVEETELEFF